MTEQEHPASEATEAVKPLDLVSLDLNFVPEWARKPGAQNDYFNYEPREERSDRKRSERSAGPGRGRGRPDSGARREERPQRGPRPEGRPRRDDQPPRGRPGPARRPERQQVQHEEILPLNVRFIPLPAAISQIARKIQANRRAHPLLQVASLYLSNPETIVARVEVDKEARDIAILQCTKCGMIAIQEDTLNRHLVAAHMDEFIEKIEEQVEPPKGIFSSVAQCGLSGVLLGPSNHHSYLAKIRETHSRLYPHMSLESYTSHIKTVRDPEAIERWKLESSKQVVYRLRSDPGAAPMTQAQAQANFLKDTAPQYIKKTRRAALPVPLCRSIEDMGLQLAIKNEWIRENRFPISLMMALRGAFVSKGLHVFKAGQGKGITFVTPIAITPIKVDHVTEALKEVLLYLEAHPGSSRAALLAALRPNAAPESDEAKALFAPLHWMIDRGHIIEFFDGTLSFPR